MLIFTGQNSATTNLCTALLEFRRWWCIFISLFPFLKKMCNKKKIFFFNSRSQSVHVGVNDDEDKGNDKIEDQPDVDHLDVRSCRKALVHLHRSLK